MNNITQTIKILALATILSFGISFAYAWTPPTIAPTGGNTVAPLNTSSTNQTKTGSLTLGGNIGANAMAISNAAANALQVVGGATFGGLTRADGGFQVDGQQVIDGDAGWHRTYGNTGWYNGTWGGGWHMSDSTWIRSYGGKNVYSDATIRADGGFQVDGNQVIDADAGWHRTYGNTGWYNGTYCGGWYMQDSTWIRSYCGRSVYIDNSLLVAGSATAGSFLYSSDRNLKKNIVPLSGQLEKISQLKGVSFDWKKNDKHSLGLIAQEVEKVYPDLVSTDKTTGLKAVEYGNLVAPLIEAVKEQQKEIEFLKMEIENLKAK